jgi:hypothetical protein
MTYLDDSRTSRRTFTDGVAWATNQPCDWVDEVVHSIHLWVEKAWTKAQFHIGAGVGVLFMLIILVGLGLSVVLMPQAVAALTRII